MATFGDRNWKSENSYSACIFKKRETLSFPTPVFKRHTGARDLCVCVNMCVCVCVFVCFCVELACVSVCVCKAGRRLFQCRYKEVIIALATAALCARGVLTFVEKSDAAPTPHAILESFRLLSLPKTILMHCSV